MRTAREPTTHRRGSRRLSRQRGYHRRRLAWPKKTALIILDAGADYFLALKDNQPTLHELAKKRLDHLPSAWCSEVECDHGRIEHRELRLTVFDLDVSLFPLARQMCSLTRHYQIKNGGDAKVETRHFITSIEEDQASHARLAALGREHWSVENKNHWRRDASRWREDRSVRRTPNGAKNLALLRGAILAILPMDEFDSINVAFDHYTEKRTQAIRLLTQTSPRCP